jgi:hypothetical protein
MRTLMRLVPIGMLAAPLAAAAGVALGQNPTNQGQAPPAGFAAVSGLVVDSVVGSPLIGAVVMVDGSLRQGISDSSGRFRIDSIEPGPRQLGVFHPLLDSLSMGITTRSLDLKAGATAFVMLATPSAPTIVSQFCRTPQMAGEAQTGPVLLIGRVLDANTDQPVPGVRVTLLWTHVGVTNAGVHRVPFRRDTVTGRSGEFHFCYLPAGLQAVVRATRFAPGGGAVMESVERQLDIGQRLIGIVALHTPTVGPPPSVPSAGQSTAPAGATVSGRVVHIDGSPVQAASVFVPGSPDSAVTGSDGQFALRGVHPGTRSLVVRAIGYEPVVTTVEASALDPRNVNVALGMKVAILDSIRVVGRLTAGYERIGFATRRNSGAGTYMTAQDIAKKQEVDFHSLFYGVPGVRVNYGADGQPYLTGSRASGCVNFVVDGVQYHEAEPGDIDTFVRPQDIGALEVYDATSAPAQFQMTPTTAMPSMGTTRGPSVQGTMSSSSLTLPGSPAAGRSGVCAVIIIWTKNRLGL